MQKKILAALLAALCILTGCGQKPAVSEAPSMAPIEAPPTLPNLEVDLDTIEPTADWEAGYLPQLAAPEAGRPLLTLHTSMGDITMMLFPEAAPLAVENICRLAEEGYYDNLTFHRVIENFMIQGGDPVGNGTGGESVWHRNFPDEFSDNLHNFRGAVSMANAGFHTNGSQFFIVQATPEASGLTDELKDRVLMTMLQNDALFRALDQLYTLKKQNPTEEAYEEFQKKLQAELDATMQAGVTDAVRARFEPIFQEYQKLGGTPHLDYKHTVFGQVIEGMEVVDAIAKVEVGANDRPATEVKILSTTLSTAK